MTWVTRGSTVGHTRGADSRLEGLTQMLRPRLLLLLFGVFLCFPPSSHVSLWCPQSEKPGIGSTACPWPVAHGALAPVCPGHSHTIHATGLPPSWSLFRGS